MNQLQENDIGCPYCGETITILIDESVESQQYIEDCQVCCRPIEVVVYISPDGDSQIEVRGEDE
jgi:hypothetical protein